MNPQQDSQSKTEKPTPKKLLDAQKKGQIARSRELSTTVMMISASVGLIVFSGQIGAGIQDLLINNLQLDNNVIGDKELMIDKFASMTVNTLFVLLPFFLLMMISAFAGPLALGGWAFTMSSWQPKLNRMSLLSGFKRMFGAQGFVEMIKSLGKFVVIGLVAFIVLGIHHEKILAMSTLPVIEGMNSGLIVIGQLFLLLSFSLILIAMIDVPYQLVSHFSKLKMSIQEIREENKQTNGNPELKARVRSLQREVSQRRMLVEVAEADVVITNPTHYSVALKYDESKAGAPYVVASGVDFMALRIREVAAGNDVVIFSAPPLARAIYQHTEVGQELPSALYHAAAQVLAYVYQIRSLSEIDKRLVEKPTILDIPEEYQVDPDLNTPSGGES